MLQLPITNYQSPIHLPMMNIPALTTAQMVEVDRLMIEEYGILLIQMMENAGRILAQLARQWLGGQVQGKRVVVLCGAGNNGGGAMVAARHLHNWGADVGATLVADPAKLKDVPAHQWDILQALACTQADEPDLARADLVVDGMIGYGLQGDPRGLVAKWIERVNVSGRDTLSLDTPSGLNTTTGQPGTPCINASATLTLALPKVGLMSHMAQAVVGELYLADISIPPQLYRTLQLDVPPLFHANTLLKLT